MSNPRKRIAIIGAGASGITGIKECIDAGLTPVCFERTGEIGGLWHFTKEVRDDQACVMKTTVINTSKEMMCYSDFPIPAEFPNFMHNTKVLDYFHLYVKKFDLEKYIRFHTEIKQISKAENFESTGQWELKVKDIKDETKGVVTEIFDGILVCTGHHQEKNIPNFIGAETFKGQIVHPHDYKDHVGYEGKRVVIVGVGNSGGDVAVELSRIASQVYLSTRRGMWVINRIENNGLPTDLQNIKRVFESLKSAFGQNRFNDVAEHRLNKRFDHAMYGLKPKHRFNAQHPTVNDDLPNRICCGSIIVKPDIRRLLPNGVEFMDGTVAEDIDVVITATGYKFGFPFLDKEVVDVKDNVVPLYKFVFPPDLKPCTLAIVGCVQPWGAIMPISELQCRWAAQLFKGEVDLPTSDTMWEDIRGKQEAMFERYVASKRHTIQVDWIPYMDELADMIGAKPDFKQLFFKDPKLALQMYFGPCTPYQYRVNGPNTWSGARQAIMTTWERVNKPLQTRKLDIPIKENEGINYKKLLVLMVIIAVLFRCIFM